jgi:hypothetical protein
MRNILLATVIALLPVCSAQAQSSSTPKPDKSAISGRQLPVKRAGGSNACAVYGPGFVKVEGTETCVRAGGAVSIGVGNSTPSGWH